MYDEDQEIEQVTLTRLKAITRQRLADLICNEDEEVALKAIDLFIDGVNSLGN